MTDKTGVNAIAAERQRQVEKGYTVEHDAEHGAADLIEAARAYIVQAEGPEAERISGIGPDFHWPWGDFTGEDCDPLTALARAGALIAAAYDTVRQHGEIR